MIGVDQYKFIRHLYAVEGLSKRQIARRLGISRNTVARYCNGQNVPWERQTAGRRAHVVTTEVRNFVQHCLDQDKLANRKQRHTARRIYERLRDELGFTGGESTIRQVVAEMKSKMPEVYVPLSFAPGEAGQVDWGSATVIMAGKKIEANLFCVRLCFSGTPFVMAFPSQREEAFLEGHQRAFEFFGGVPRTAIYDNLKTAVKEGWGKTAKEQDKFRAFRAHYAYESSFCNPGEGHEKGLVENLVGYIRRNVLLPIPEVQNWEELNQLLLNRCEKYRDEHHIRGREMPVCDAFALEKTALIPLPARPYEAVKIAEPKVDYFATAPFEGNRYSVPVQFAGQTVTVKASAFKIDIYYRGNLIAHHQRSYAQKKTLYKLEHYIPLLELKPRSVRHARPVKEANLPEELWNFARNLKDPDRSIVRLLRLIVNHGIEQILKAVHKAVENDQYSVEIVEHYATEQTPAVNLHFKGPTVQTVDLSRYDHLLSGGEAS